MALFDELVSFLLDGDTNFHSHKCERCGAEWAHSDACRFLPDAEHNAAHKCSKCGTEQFTKNRYTMTKDQADELNKN